VKIKEVGSFNPKPYVREALTVGETGYITANIKSPKDVKMGTPDRLPAIPHPRCRVSGSPSDGVQRDLPDQHRPITSTSSRTLPNFS
jgi:hypothetical protein